DGGAWSACASPKTYTGLADGGHTFDVRAVDAADEADPTPATHSWSIDASPPNTTITGNPPAVSNSSSASFSFSSSEPGSTLACRLDGGNFSACTSPASYTGLANSSHTFEVRAADAIGNVDPTPASFTWAIDTVRPSVTINQAAGQADPTSSSPIHFTVVF